MKDERLLLHNILDAADKIEQYLQEGSYADFRRKEMLYDAVLMELAVIGEMASRVSAPMRKKLPHIPWSKSRGLRNRIVYEYHGLSDRILWTLCTRDLPLLQKSIRDFFKKYGSLDPQ